MTLSILSLRQRLADAEERLAIARRRRDPFPAVVACLADEAASLRAALRQARAARFERSR